MDFTDRQGAFRMRKAGTIVLAAAALALAGCSAAQVFEKMPQSMGGLPENAPKQPDTPYLYPAVHDMPAARTVKPLTDEEQLKLEQDLISARTTQQNAAAADAQANQTPPPPAQPAPPAKAKKKPDNKAGTAAKP